MNTTYETNHEWEKLARRIVASRQLVLVIGSADTGKSSFCRFLADFAVAEGLKVGFVDADIGQSQIGPPTTIGFKCFAPKTETPLKIDGDADALYFVGAASPRRNLLEVVTGTRLMVDAARDAECDFIVVDTTGYVHENAAIVLKQHKIELLQPNHLVCIGRSTELERITAGYSPQAWLAVHHLLPHPRVRLKSNKARARHRKSRLNAYFADSTVQQVPFEQIRGGRTSFFIGRIANEKELEILTRLTGTEVHHAEWGKRTLCLIASGHLSKTAIASLKNYLSLERVTTEVRAAFAKRLVGLIGTSGDILSIGIVEALDFQKRELSIRCKPEVAKDACTLQFGDYRIEAS